MSDVFITVVSGVPTAVNLAVPGVQGPMGLSTLPSGGTVGQIVVKQSAVNFDAVWTSAASGLTLQGATRFALGSSSLPSVTFTGDTNTGIYSPGADQVAISTNGTGRLFVDASGRVGIGGTPSVETFGVNRNISGGTTAFSIYTAGVIQSDVTGQASYYAVAAQTAAAAFTLADLRCFNATQGTFGAGSVVTNQYGYFAAAGLIGATNNYGFFSNIPTGTGRWNFYASSTADSYFASNNFIFANGGTERARIDSNGRLLVGTSSGRNNYYGSINPPGIQNEVGYGTLFLNANNATGSAIFMGKSRGTTALSNTIVQADDDLGTIVFFGADGTNAQPAAQIAAEVDGTPGANDMPGRLVFSTTADGAATPTERMRITSAGNVGIGTASPGYTLDVAGSAKIGNPTGDAQLEIGTGASVDRSAYVDLVGDTTYADFGLRLLRGNTGANAISALQHRGTGELRLSTQDAAPISFLTTNAERARIDSSGRLLVGTSSATASFYGTTPTRLSISTPLGCQLVETVGAAHAFGSRIDLYKTRGATSGSAGIVQAGDEFGSFSFGGSDGVGPIPGASITAIADGTPGTNDMPGRLVFSTTADGASSPTERFRITNDGVQAYNQLPPAAVNATATLTVANLKAGIITSTSAAATDMTLPTGTDTQAGFGATYDNMTFEWSVINTGPSLVRVLAGTAHTVVGSGSVATGTSGRFASRRTAANTFVTYRLS